MFRNKYLSPKYPADPVVYINRKSTVNENRKNVVILVMNYHIAQTTAH